MHPPPTPIVPPFPLAPQTFLLLFEAALAHLASLSRCPVSLRNGWHTAGAPNGGPCRPLPPSPSPEVSIPLAEADGTSGGSGQRSADLSADPVARLAAEGEREEEQACGWKATDVTLSVWPWERTSDRHRKKESTEKKGQGRCQRQGKGQIRGGRRGGARMQGEGDRCDSLHVALAGKVKSKKQGGT